MQRTIRQNSSLHLYLTHVAQALDDAGLDMRETIRVPIKPTMENVKELMWRPVMSALYPEIKSTTELSTAQMCDVYEVFNRAIGERLGVHVPWPSEETR